MNYVIVDTLKCRVLFMMPDPGGLKAIEARMNPHDLQRGCYMISMTWRVAMTQPVPVMSLCNHEDPRVESQKHLSP